MSLRELKTDMLFLIDLSAKIAKYNQMLLHHNDSNDKRNFDIEKCDKIKQKVLELNEKFYEVKEKWFN